MKEQNQSQSIPEDFRLASYHFDLPEAQIAQQPSAERGGSRLYVLRRKDGDKSAELSGASGSALSAWGQASDGDKAARVAAAAGAAELSAGSDELSEFSRLPDFLPPRCLFVANNSRVIPARLHGRRLSGGRFEALLLSPLPLIEGAAELAQERAASCARNDSSAEAGRPVTSSGYAEGGCSRIASDKSQGSRGDAWMQARATVLLRPAKKLNVGETYDLGSDSGEKQAEGSSCLRLTVLEKGQFGQAEVMLQWTGSLLERVCACGSLPLPPYIRREAGTEDLERYQTTFCDPAKAGSVAAPTAGLHFTPQMRAALGESGHEWAELTLFVGYGTFSPVRAEDIRQHQMHPEYVEISAETIEKIRRAKAEGRPVIAVGTTSTRVLEGLVEKEVQEAARLFSPPGRNSGTVSEQPQTGGAEFDNSLKRETGGESDTPRGGAELLKPYTGWLNCFIYPGKPIRVIDGLITNFHLPESTLLMLVSTLCGRERLLAAYRRAVREKFRFFSYGDAMLII